ncbi:unnamed protein product [Meloidogyne enterolobii]|uniref:Uncharacterized protein n=1 Tax=Meloidogyne enterolobii TaxID=390850 RepID=A0ACB0Y9W6_MELEN
MESLKIIFLLAFVLMIGGLVFAQLETQLEGGSGERMEAVEVAEEDMEYMAEEEEVIMDGIKYAEQFKYLYKNVL